MNNSNLKSWSKGVSGNPAGRPRGSKNIRTYVKEMLFSTDTYKYTPSLNDKTDVIPIQAIIAVLIEKSMQGDIKAAITLLDYANDDYKGDDQPTVALVEFVNPPDFTKA